VAPPELIQAESTQVETIKVGTGKKGKKETIVVVEFSGALNAESASNGSA
jgi:FKBP-type peptidyl-prolyl cis-trans isomerase